MLFYGIMYFLLFMLYLAVTAVCIIAIDAGIFGERIERAPARPWRHWMKLMAASIIFFSTQEAYVLGKGDASFAYTKSIVNECRAALGSYSYESTGYYKQCLSGCSFSRWVCFTLL